MGTARDLLQHAANTLNGHGIAAVPAFGTHPQATRVVIRRAILSVFPFGSGAYVFWTATDDSNFRADGTLSRPLTLHYSGPSVGAAVDAAVRHIGLSTNNGPRPLTMLINCTATD